MTDEIDNLTEAEASSYAGVSLQTLARFAEAGYLKVYAKGGQKSFSKREIAEVFGLSLSSSEHLESPRKSSSELKITQVDTASPCIKESEDSSPETTTSCTTLSPVATPESDIPQTTPRTVEGSSVEGTTLSPTSSTTSSPSSHSLEREIQRLTTITTLQEKILESREAEIRDLKEERSWLRLRIERLDEKADRDQLLLLSETQVIRKLITQQQTNKRGLMRGALEWLGVVDSPQTLTQGMIDVTPQEFSKGKNAQ